MNVARGLNRHDSILSFLSLSRTNIDSKTFLRSLCEILILCDFLNLVCLRNHRDVSVIIGHSVSIFLSIASSMTGLVNFVFHIMKILGF